MSHLTANAPYLSESNIIEGHFIPQLYVSDDHAVDMESVKFDATESVLKLPLVKLQQLANACLTPDEQDDLVPSWIVDGNGYPFRVDYLDSAVQDFFGVSNGSEITQEMLDTARQVHRIDEVKSYHALVERTITARVWVEVEATSEEQARRLAIDKSHDIDFNSEGQKGEPQYAVDEINEAQVVNAPIQRPRP